MLSEDLLHQLDGKITTSSSGIDRLMHLYDYASKHTDSSILIDFSCLEWMDANLSALVSALEHRLKKEKNTELTADFEHVAEKFSVLFRNGWFKDENIIVKDDPQSTTMSCTSFLPTDKDKFIAYIENELIPHRGMPQLPKTIIQRIKSGLIEIFTNVYRHAQTTDPLFVCGQYYPQNKQLILTMVDLGVGFLEPIYGYTNGAINSDIDAINWALQGRSSQEKDHDDIGGFGLQTIHDYFLTNKGAFQIYSGTAFWGTDIEQTSRTGFQTMNYDFKGSLINLIFDCS